MTNKRKNVSAASGQAPGLPPLPGHLDESELPVMLERVLRLALSRTHCKNGIIALAAEEGGALAVESQAVKGDLLAPAPRRLLRGTGRASGIVFWVLDHNQPYLANDISQDPHYVPLFKGIQSSLAVPLSFQNRCLGVIVVESRERDAFTAGDQQALAELARGVTMLVRRAQLFSQTRQAAGGQPIMIRGLSPAWEEVERRVERAAATEATVILRGESGTGKELVAHAIHFNSPRKKMPFVVVNCAAIPAALLESELFGHRQGAYTGATYDRTGQFALAHGGTIFLDEIGDLSLPLQIKLLRVLATGEIQKLGSDDPPGRVQVRVLAATSRDLEAMMQRGQFREDLYYRLHVVPIYLPPLRTYKSSIPGLVRVFVGETNQRYQKLVAGLTDAAMTRLLDYDFPGNVRELKNIVERAVILCDGEAIDEQGLPAELFGVAPGAAAASAAWDYRARRESVLQTFEQTFVAGLLQKTRGKVSEAAKLAKIHRVQFYQLLRRTGIDPAAFRG